MISKTRKEEIRDKVIATLNGMGSHFFHATMTLETSEEAQYAASLWQHGSYDYNEPMKASFKP